MSWSTITPRAAGGEHREVVQHLDLVVQVEVGEGLVEQIQARLLHQQRGDGEALALAAGEGGHLALGKAGEAHLPARPSRWLRPRGLPSPSGPGRVAADEGGFEHRGAEEVGLALGQQAAQAGLVAAGPGVGLAGQQHTAPGRVAQAGQGVQQGALAGAVAAEDPPVSAGCSVKSRRGTSRRPR
jgi:hypothetical protein